MGQDKRSPERAGPLQPRAGRVTPIWGHGEGRHWEPLTSCADREKGRACPEGTVGETGLGRGYVPRAGKEMMGRDSSRPSFQYQRHHFMAS